MCSFGLVLALMAAPAGAQTTVVAGWSAVQGLALGTQVRIKDASRSSAGKLDAVTDDSLVMTTGKGRETFGRQQVVTVSAKKPNHRGRNTLIGLGIGAAAGVVVGVAGRNKTGQLNIIPNSVIIGGTTAVGALIGTLIGVVIPTGGWRVIYKK